MTNCNLFTKKVCLYISTDLDKIEPSVETWDTTATRSGKFDFCHLLRDVSMDQTVFSHTLICQKIDVQAGLYGLWE